MRKVLAWLMGTTHHAWVSPLMQDPPLGARRFRPVQHKSAAVELFRAIARGDVIVDTKGKTVDESRKQKAKG